MTTWSGTPNREIHVVMKAFATDNAVISERGHASIHRVALSMNVSKYLKWLIYGSVGFLTGFNGPTMSNEEFEIWQMVN